MRIRDEYDLEFLVNESERLVLEQLERQLEKGIDIPICTCQECVLDMAALALNNVKPLYRVSLLGTLYAHAVQRSEYECEITRAVSEAVEKIARNPSHAT